MSNNKIFVLLTLIIVGVAVLLHVIYVELFLLWVWLMIKVGEQP